MMNKRLAILKELAKEIDIILTDKQIEEFNLFGDLLAVSNEKFNLTAIESEIDVIIKHFIDSMSIIKFINAQAEMAPAAPLKFVDVGAGAGFPGIPVKIVLGDRIDATLIEATGKKVTFLNRVIDALGLKGIKAVCLRAEIAGRAAEYRDAADVVAARAVAPLPVLLELCAPLLRENGVFVALKSVSDAVDAELSEARIIAGELGCEIELVERFCLPLPETQDLEIQVLETHKAEIHRSVITVRKICKTPEKYPRRDGTPAKRPLGSL
ncbi:MAG: 16S rRNA (guanine(527)-N(7))-methyltransferase RsmG [Synergistaceae bacterium]|nr:16S rRNA (guanine(527)-N(7))-methyltransferase RsmG [Synergistaceae bacterium]